MPKPAPSTAKIRKFIKQKPDKWLLLKQFMRTGERTKGIGKKTISDFAQLGFDFKEAQNARRKKPYNALLSEREKAEIKRQMRAALMIVKPEIPAGNEKKEALRHLVGRTALVQRRHFFSTLENNRAEDAFDAGRMYLDALDKGNKKKAKRRKLNVEEIAGIQNDNLILRKGWLKKKYTSTVPIHEAAHFLLGKSESKAHIIDYYYALKSGKMSLERLGRTNIGELRPFAEEAISLFELGKRQGWRIADAELRKRLGIGKKR